MGTLCKLQVAGPPNSLILHTQLSFPGVRGYGAGAGAPGDAPDRHKGLNFTGQLLPRGQGEAEARTWGTPRSEGGGQDPVLCPVNPAVLFLAQCSASWLPLLVYLGTAGLGWLAQERKIGKYTVGPR